jgi:hypothetical protein
VEGACQESQDTEGGTGNGNEILRFEHVLVDTELTRTAEIHGYKSLKQALDLPDAIIDRGWTVIDQLTLREFLVGARLSMKGWYGGKQLEAIWNLQVAHEGSFNGGRADRFARSGQETGVSGLSNWVHASAGWLG